MNSALLAQVSRALDRISNFEGVVVSAPKERIKREYCKQALMWHSTIVGSILVDLISNI